MTAATTGFASLYAEALAESKAHAPALNPAAQSFYMPSAAPMDPAAALFCPEKMIRSEVTMILSSSLPDGEREDSTLQRSAWKQTKGAPASRVTRTPRGKVVPRTKSSRATAENPTCRPPTPPRTRASAMKSKKADTAPSHIKKHLDQLQSLPLVRSGLSDLLDSLAVLPIEPEASAA